MARNPAGQIASIARSNDAYTWTAFYPVNRPYVTNGLNQYTMSGTLPFGHDTNGNLSTTPGPGTETLTYAYDIENRLVGRTSTGATPLLTLVYDPLGRLFSFGVGGGATTTFLWDGSALVAEYNGATLLRRYAHWVGADVPAIWYEGADLTDPRYLFADHQGSIIARTNTSGQSTLYTYDEYGIPGQSSPDRFRYTGQIWLPELGMYHYKARIYSPSMGRFLQTDPVGYEDQINLYAYVGNDPVNRTDPTGMAICGSCSGYTVQVGRVNFAALGQRFRNFLQNTAAVLQSRSEGLESCSTSQPASICGMIRDWSSRTRETIRSLLSNPERFREIRNEFIQAVREDREHGIWYNNSLETLSRRAGWRTGVPFYPVPTGGTILLHFHLVGVAERRIPGLSNEELSLAARNHTMLIVLNREFGQFYWQDYRR